MSTVLRISAFKDVTNWLLWNCLFHGGKLHRKRQQGSLLSETGANMPRNSRNIVKERGCAALPDHRMAWGKIGSALLRLSHNEKRWFWDCLASWIAGSGVLKSNAIWKEAFLKPGPGICSGRFSVKQLLLCTLCKISCAGISYAAILTQRGLTQREPAKS